MQLITKPHKFKVIENVETLKAKYKFELFLSKELTIKILNILLAYPQLDITVTDIIDKVKQSQPSVSNVLTTSAMYNLITMTKHPDNKKIHLYSAIPNAIYEAYNIHIN